MPIAYRIKKHYYYIFFQFIIALESHFRIRISSNIVFGRFFSRSSFASPWFWFCNSIFIYNFSFDNGHFVILSAARCAIARVKICFQCNAKGSFDHFSQSYYYVKCSILNARCLILDKCFFCLIFSQWFNQIEVYALNGLAIGKNGLKIKCNTKERGESHHNIFSTLISIFFVKCLLWYNFRLFESLQRNLIYYLWSLMKTLRTWIYSNWKLNLFLNGWP